jgi:hypothetical protein
MSELSALHRAYLRDVAALGDDAVTQYLLECLEFIKNDDLEGWKREFGDEGETPEPPKKRRRGAPSRKDYSPLPACTNCQATSLIEDYEEGQVVCTNCGLVNETQLLVETPPHLNQRIDARQVHRYSRIVYFRSFLLSVTGNTYPQLTEDERSRIKEGVEKIDTVTPTSIMSLLKKLKLHRLRRHRFYIAETFSPLNKKYRPLNLAPTLFRDMLRLFRRAELVWDKVKAKNAPNRKVFINYSFLQYQFCYQLGHPECTGPEFLIKCPKRLELLNKLYGKMCTETTLVHTPASKHGPRTTFDGGIHGQ